MGLCTWHRPFRLSYFQQVQDRLTNQILGLFKIRTGAFEMVLVSPDFVPPFRDLPPGGDISDDLIGVAGDHLMGEMGGTGLL
jgi:hypothetical protein